MSDAIRLRGPVRAAPGDRSYWLQNVKTRIPNDRTGPLTGTVHADVAIVGGGYTGLWTALRLLDRDPRLRVVVAEADFCGSGASGRNGGQVHSWFADVDALARLVPEDEALRLSRATADAVDELEALQADGTGFDLRLDGWYWTASSAAQEDAWAGATALHARASITAFDPLDAAEIRRVTGSGVSYTGVVERRAGTVHPAKLAVGLRDLAIARGVTVHEATPVRTLEPGRTCRLTTPGGRIEADRVVLAANAWLSSIPEIRRRMYVVDSQVIATEPVPDLLDSLGWTGGESICDSQLQVLYWQRTPDGRVVFGRGSGGVVFRDRLGARTNRHSRGAGENVRELHRVYPSLRGVRVDHDWLGPIDCTPAHVPVFDRLGGHDNVVYAAGWNGTGIAQIPVGSRILASLVLGSDDEWSRCGLVGADRRPTLPPEPLRYVGARVVRAAVARKNDREIRDQRPGPLTRAVVRLMPGASEQ